LLQLAFKGPIRVEDEIFYGKCDL